MKRLHPAALGYAGAALSAAGMLLLGILGSIGMYSGFVEMMLQAHMFFSLSFLGIVSGMVEAAIISFVLLYAFALLYNFFSNRAN